MEKPGEGFAGRVVCQFIVFGITRFEEEMVQGRQKDMS